MVDRIGAVFEQAEALREQGGAAPAPGPAHRGETGSASRWTVARMREQLPLLHTSSLAGLSKYVRHCGIELRQGPRQYSSPALASRQKAAALLEAFMLVGQPAEENVALFLDEMSYPGWPEASTDWCGQAPAPDPWLSASTVPIDVIAW